MPMAYKWVDLATGETATYTRNEDTAFYDEAYPGDPNRPGYDHGTAGPAYELRAVFWEDDDAER